jgi:hypothetical protein
MSLRVSLAVLVMALAAACGTERVTQTETETVTTTQFETVTVTVTQQAAPPPPRVFVPQHNSLMYKPDVIGLGVSNAIEDIRWASYGGATAVGRGIFPSNDCTPSCAEGTITRLPVTVKLRGRSLCRGELVYDLIALEGRGFDNTYDVISDDTNC